ncbi:MAG: hypothetical protein ACRDQ5_26120, partial [Sciscionella sp.]
MGPRTLGRAGASCRRVVVALGAAVLALSALASCTPARQPRHDHALAADPAAATAVAPPLGIGEAIPPRLHWTGCGGRFQCATAEVPLDYHHPNG